MHSGAARPSATHDSRGGLTLIELLLVLALLVVITAVTMPVLEGTFSRASLRGAGDLLRGAWAQARLSALNSGTSHAFRYEQNGSRFQIVPLDAIGSPEFSMMEVIDPEAEPEPAEFVRIENKALPEGITFLHGNVSSSAKLMATMPVVAEGPWSAPILFYPDGTTSDATVLLANDREQAIRVTLRGLTGTSQMADADIEEASP